MHLNITLTGNIELPARRRSSWAGGLEVVRTDSGREVRNQRWSSPERSYEVSLIHRELDHADVQAVLALWDESQGGTHSFEIYDWIDEEPVRVRFDSDLEHTMRAEWLIHTDTFTLREVKA